jgi:hypothetical protein
MDNEANLDSTSFLDSFAQLDSNAVSYRNGGYSPASY